MSMYVKVKRQKTTVFLLVEPTDSVSGVKQKLQDLIQQPPDKQRLHKDDSVLEETSSLADQGVENGDVLALTYCGDDGVWEKVNIVPLEDAREG